MPAAREAVPPPPAAAGERARSHGLRVAALRSRLSVRPFQPNSGRVVLPRNTQLASRRRATAGQSARAGCVGGDERAVAGGEALDVQIVLDGDGHTVEQAARGAGEQPRLGVAGHRQGAGGIDDLEGVEPRLQRLDPLQVQPRDLHRGQRPAAVASSATGLVSSS